MNSTFLNSVFFQEEISIDNLTINQSGIEDSTTSVYENVTLILSLNSSVSKSRFAFSSNEKYVIGSVYMLITLLGLGLNSLTIFIVGLGNNIGKEFKIQLINLAVADIVLAVLDPAYTAIHVLRLPFPESPILCKILCFAGNAANYTSLLCNAAICLERFVIIFFPFKASQYTKRHKLLVIAAVWIAGALPGSGSLIYANIKQSRNSFRCQDKPIPDRSLDPILRTLKYVTPAFLIVSVYTMVFVKLCFQKSNGMKRNLSNQWKKDLDKVITIILSIELTCCVFIQCVYRL